MLCAFLAGLVTVGVAVLMPGGESRNQDALSSQGESEAPAAISPGTTQPSAMAVGTKVPTPRLAIVVEDNGYDTTRDAEWLKFPEKITVAVIPFGPSSRRLAKAAHERGFGVLINVPMEPLSPISDRTDGFRLRRGMSRKEMAALLDRMSKENTWADPESMATFAALLKSRGLFFLDNMTTSRSVAVQSAREAGIPVVRRDVFFDTDMEPEEMRLQWKRALSIAKKKGEAVLVCHGRKESLRAILDLVADLDGEGVRAVTLDELIAREKSG
jgi:polysaccharide deacetylase 2 family uncharacterized protein YibQ